MLVPRSFGPRGKGESPRGRSSSGQHGYAGTPACLHELFVGNVEVAVSKRMQRWQAGDGNRHGDAWRHAVDTKLARLYQAALEEPIPDDMLRLVGLIGAQKQDKS